MHEQIDRVITFASSELAGNPAHVLRVGPSEFGHDYSHLCREHELDVLAILDSEGVGSPRVDFFTKKGRHPGAGHATHAAAYLHLKSETADHFQKFDGQKQAISRSGNLTCVTWPVMPYDVVADGEAVKQAIGLQPRVVFNSAFGYVAIFDDEALFKQIVPDDEKIAALPCNALVLTAPGTAADIVLRVFAPKLGLPEDPVCGTAHRIIVPYWAERLGQDRIHSKQLSPRGGDLYCEYLPDAVVISGEALSIGSIDLKRR